VVAGVTVRVAKFGFNCGRCSASVGSVIGECGGGG